MNNAQDQIDKMINDLDSVNDEFVNDYFDNENLNPISNIETLDEESKADRVSEEFDENANNYDDTFHFSEVEESSIDENSIQDDNKLSDKTFSYSDILSRLDARNDIDLNNSTDILSLIENSISSEEFFDAIEKEDLND